MCCFIQSLKYIVLRSVANLLVHTWSIQCQNAKREILQQPAVSLQNISSLVLLHICSKDWTRWNVLRKKYISQVKKQLVWCSQIITKMLINSRKIMQKILPLPLLVLFTSFKRSRFLFSVWFYCLYETCKILFKSQTNNVHCKIA